MRPTYIQSKFQLGQGYIEKPYFNHHTCTKKRLALPRYLGLCPVDKKQAVYYSILENLVLFQWMEGGREGGKDKLGALPGR